MTSPISGDMTTVPGIPVMSPAESGDLRPGQRIAARVVELLESGEVLLELGQIRAAVPANSLLHLGDRVMLEVVVAGATPEFRIVTDAAAAAVWPAAAVQPDNGGFQRVLDPVGPRDLPVLMQALADVGPGAVPMADALQEFLRAATVLDVRRDVMDQIQRLAVPLDAALPPEALAVMIRTFLAQSGLFTESHLRAALKSGRGLASTAVPHQTGADLRMLLGQLTTGSTPVPDAVRSLSDALLQQQLVLAERLAGAGVGHVTIPVMFGQERVDVVFEWEREARGAKRDETDHGIVVGVFVCLPALGAIEARLEWRPDSLAVTFYVEREATRALAEAGLAAFSEQLSRTGCPAVTSNVWLNPARIASAAAPVATPVPGGTILDVIA